MDADGQVILSEDSTFTTLESGDESGIDDSGDLRGNNGGTGDQDEDVPEALVASLSCTPATGVMG